MSFVLALEKDTESFAAPTDMASLPPSPIGTARAADYAAVSDRFVADRGPLLQALELVKIVPNSPTAQSRLAQAAFNVGEANTAIRAARRSLQLNTQELPHDDAAVAVAIQVLRMTNRLDIVEGLAPTVGDRDATAEVSAERGRFAEALSVLAGSSSPARLALAGWLHLSMHNYEAAVRDLRRCLRSGGARPDVLTNLGYAYSVLGVHQRALAATAQAAHLAPRSRTIAFNLVNCLVALKKPAEALQAIQRLKTIHPRDVKVISAATRVRFQCGDSEGALRELRQSWNAIDLNALSAESRSELAANIVAMEWQLGRRSRADAMTTLSRVLMRSQYASLSVARMLAGLSSKAADADNLAAVLTQLRKSSNASPVWAIESKLLYLRCEFDAAIEQARRWEREYPLDEGPPLLLTLLIADHRGEYRKAAELGEAALKRLPASLMLANNVAYAWALAGQPRRARKWLPAAGPAFQERPYLVATAALISLAEGNLAAGSRGYERAAEIIAETGDNELASFARLRGVVAAIQTGYRQVVEDNVASLSEYNDPPYVLLRETIGRLGRS